VDIQRRKGVTVKYGKRRTVEGRKGKEEQHGWVPGKAGSREGRRHPQRMCARRAHSTLKAHAHNMKQHREQASGTHDTHGSSCSQQHRTFQAGCRG
jgi:hypothetical protein